MSNARAFFYPEESAGGKWFRVMRGARSQDMRPSVLVGDEEYPVTRAVEVDFLPDRDGTVGICTRMNLA